MTMSRTIRPIEVTVSFGDVRASATIAPGPQRYGTRDALHRVVDSFADQLNLPHTTLTNGMNSWAPTQNGETVRAPVVEFREANKVEPSEEDHAALVEALATARARLRVDPADTKPAADADAAKEA